VAVEDRHQQRDAEDPTDVVERHGVVHQRLPDQRPRGDQRREQRQQDEREEVRERDERVGAGDEPAREDGVDQPALLPPHLLLE
jgi:hypothetical protein